MLTVMEKQSWMVIVGMYCRPSSPKGALNYGLRGYWSEQIDYPMMASIKPMGMTLIKMGGFPDICGIQTIGLENTGNLEGGDCWDNPIPPTVDSRIQL